jgi:hypothetical protein
MAEAQKSAVCGCTPAASGYCCERAELATLRQVVDQAVRVLTSEVTAPVVIGEGGELREVIAHTAQALRAARQTAA